MLNGLINKPSNNYISFLGFVIMGQILKKLIFGSRPVSSTGEYRYAMLRGEYALILVLCCGFYVAYNLVIKVYDYIPYYALGMAVGVVILYLNRRSYFKQSTVLFLVTINSLVYLFADVQNSFGSVFLFFSICSLLALVFLHNHHLLLRSIFVPLPFFLGLLAFYTDLKLLGAVNPTKYNFLINFSISMSISILFVRFLLHRNEDEIRERKLVEEELKVQNDLLSKTNRELDHFVYSVSHDLKAPLSSIQGLTNLYTLTQSSEERAEINGMIQDRVKDLDAFIKEVLDYSRNERLELNLSLISPSEILKKVMSSLDHMEGFDNVTIEDKIDSEFEVKTDPDRLQVIITNLLANAITYRDSSKRATVIAIEIKDQGEQWQFSISDNGIGIDDVYHQKIFEMFYRADDQTGTGSGLGLYIVHETVKRLSGSISVESQPGVGTTFRIDFKKLK